MTQGIPEVMFADIVPYIAVYGVLTLYPVYRAYLVWFAPTRYVELTQIPSNKYFKRWEA